MKERVLEVPNNVFLEEVRCQLKAGHTATFRVRGWSMRPFLEHARDKVLLVPTDRRPVKVGDVALVLDTMGRYVLHRVVALSPDGSCTLWGDGNVMGREQATAENVIGVAQGFYIGRKERYVDVDSRQWRWYSWLWMHTTPLRRWVLLGYRVMRKIMH